MKLSKEKIIELIREELNEMAGDDWDQGAHVWHKRQGRERRGEPDPRSRPVSDPSQSRYVQGDHDRTREVVRGLIRQAGGDEALADSIMAAVQEMKENGLI